MYKRIFASKENLTYLTEKKPVGSSVRTINNAIRDEYVIEGNIKIKAAIDDYVMRHDESEYS